MRHLTLQRFVALLLLAGITASVLPFGRDAVARERWITWLRGYAGETHREALDAALASVLPDVPPGAQGLVQALAQREEADPAWFGLESFSPEDVLRLSQQMAAVPVATGDGPALVQGAASPPPAPGASLAGLQADPAAVDLAVGNAAPTATPAAAPFALLIGAALSPRAP